MMIILEMANNHMGNLTHGLRIIDAFAQVCEAFPYRFGFKLQYRQLDTFIHPDYRQRMDVKYVKRFMETRLSREDFGHLVGRIRERGFTAICTPFDEASVDAIEADGFDIIKVASCSLTDWPLLERIVQTNKPIIASTAAATIDEIDSVVSFLSHRNKDFTLMHCVAEYPTPPQRVQLNQIDYLKNRYPGVPIGYSTHERPDFFDSLPMVVAKGAKTFERHVGLASHGYAVNDYSATPEQFRQWVEKIQQAEILCGVSGDVRVQAPVEEVESLRALRRGAFAAHDIQADKRIGGHDLFFAIPCQADQVTANEWSKYRYFSATQQIAGNAPLLHAQSIQVNSRERIQEIVHSVNTLLRKGNIVVPGAADLEISHHFGPEHFYKVGATMITVINQSYCKKLLVLLPGQRHPEHYHAKKHESFYVLMGTLHINLDGQDRVVNAGEVVPVANGVRHSFRSDTGVIFEEVSTTHFANDSFYTDPSIQANPHRKTILTYWMDNSGPETRIGLSGECV